MVDSNINFFKIDSRVNYQLQNFNNKLFYSFNNFSCKSSYFLNFPHTKSKSSHRKYNLKVIKNHINQRNKYY